MYTFCPHCVTVFAVKDDHLHAAGGQVRCGHCRQQFSVVNYLFEEIASARDAAAAHQASRDQSVMPEADNREVERLVQKIEASAVARNASRDQSVMPEADSREMDRLLQKMKAGPVAREASVDDLVVTRADTLEVEELVRKMEASPGTGLSLPGGWQERAFAWHDVISGIGIGLLILLLGIQWLYFNRAELANQTAWRPTMERFCDFLDCDLPLPDDHLQVELVERDVRRHPSVDDALLINATLVNKADRIQPFPIFSLSFSDFSGKPIAMRHFRPAEYLGDTAAVKTGMIPESRVQAVLEIVDPGKDAVSFQIDFH